MKEVHTYIADDGAAFDDKYECMSYELIQNNKDIEGIRFFNEDGKRISLAEVMKSYMTDVHKIAINNMNQYLSFKKVSDENNWFGLDEITESGTWKYLDEAGCFIRVDDLIKDFVGQIKWERDNAMNQLEELGIPFGSKFENITENYQLGNVSPTEICNLVFYGNAQIIQTGGFDDI